MTVCLSEYYDILERFDEEHIRLLNVRVLEKEGELEALKRVARERGFCPET